MMKSKSFPTKMRNKAKMSTIQHLFNSVLGDVVSAIREEKEPDCYSHPAEIRSLPLM